MTILINLRLYGGIFTTGIFGNFYTKQYFWLPEREFPVALNDM